MSKKALITGIARQYGSYISEQLTIMMDADLEMNGFDSTGEGRKILHEKEMHWAANRVSMF